MTKISKSTMRAEANSLSVQINNLGGSRVLKNNLYMLTLHRNECEGYSKIVADYDQRIAAKKWAFQECLELEAARSNLYAAIG